MSGLLSAHEYLEGFEQLLRQFLGGAWRPGSGIVVMDGDLDGDLVADLDLADGYRLVVGVTVDVMMGPPAWSLYSFHLQDAEHRCVFRYDNFGHHSDLAPETFPHHKHEGEAIVASAQPTVHQVIAEVQRVLAGEDA